MRYSNHIVVTSVLVLVSVTVVAVLFFWSPDSLLIAPVTTLVSQPLTNGQVMLSPQQAGLSADGELKIKTRANSIVTMKKAIAIATIFGGILAGASYYVNTAGLSTLASSDKDRLFSFASIFNRIANLRFVKAITALKSKHLMNPKNFPVYIGVAVFAVLIPLYYKGYFGDTGNNDAKKQECDKIGGEWVSSNQTYISPLSAGKNSTNHQSASTSNDSTSNDSTSDASTSDASTSSASTSSAPNSSAPNSNAEANNLGTDRVNDMNSTLTDQENKISTIVSKTVNQTISNATKGLKKIYNLVAGIVPKSGNKDVSVNSDPSVHKHTHTKNTNSKDQNEDDKQQKNEDSTSQTCSVHDQKTEESVCPNNNTMDENVKKLGSKFLNISVAGVETGLTIIKQQAPPPEYLNQLIFHNNGWTPRFLVAPFYFLTKLPWKKGFNSYLNYSYIPSWLDIGNIDPSISNNLNIVLGFVFALANGFVLIKLLIAQQIMNGGVLPNCSVGVILIVFSTLVDFYIGDD
ncbi:hypothetical protein DI09_16p230 [Mitosporidium daphniae]|uniref:Uncharacterized protein n=1 Tax=Mitosporidium daphniae TaxID=1485682 RepID=A0A098VUG6_9MICR|nr:uncharacterized protein DI09_16p230 [Mitosporidium daphniae]KGG52469.1 hypothetical protein DI09_16p230 [Mitosporidium daphniae]|eukprot:XP_013238896.1 uncharacterized protein DI09_16p230 [Mitosporidium daphniae]